MATTSSPPRLHHKSLFDADSLLLRRNLMKISLHELKIAITTTTKIEKKVPIMPIAHFRDALRLASD